MLLRTIDWAIIGTFFGFTLIVGLVVSRRAGRTQSDFFLSGRGMPWWLLGTSMVATTFAADTPLLVTSIVREQGVAGNWVWWAFLLTGMLTVAVFAKLWRRSGILTDVEFYERRYGGAPAAFLRGFRAVYLGLVFNVLVMANVTLAAVKIAQVMFDFSPIQAILVAATVTVIFSAAGGLRSVLLTDFVLFLIAMAGSIGAAVVALRQPEVGGLAGLLANEQVQSRLALWPSLDFSSTASLNAAMTILIIPLAVQWWAAWYPGAEPGGGGYVAQRMLAARSESHATGATLLFNFAHYALRPWPWILVALASLAIYPDLDSLRSAFPKVGDTMVRDDLAYPAMMNRMPPGLLGLIATSLIASYMSTISTMLNWGSSYLVHDFWLRFVRPKASERELVRLGRFLTVALMVLACVIALQLQSVYEGFQILLKVGAGTGLIYILRWFWWRLNAMAEIAAMAVSFLMAAGFVVLSRVAPEQTPADWLQFLIIVGGTTACWIVISLVTPPEREETLRSFYDHIRPGGPGWKAVIRRAHADGQLLDCDGSWNLRSELVFLIGGCAMIYGALFATGLILYGRAIPATVSVLVALAGGAAMAVTWRRVASGSAEPSTPGPIGEDH
ncbi:sodium:solute symporter family protein [Tautonia sp. JC769]|uniref:sodium:solute symporter family protein n=1 Tax=Tautonia sp. JC769 TaxID=3232135 RepID=UPI00345B468C